LAKGADILVHEAMYVPAIEAYVHDRIAKGSPIRFDDYMAHMKIDHSPVEDVGRIAKKQGSKRSFSRTSRRESTEFRMRRGATWLQSSSREKLSSRTI
jgi:hypothetical protein